MFHLMYCPLRFCTTDVVIVKSFVSVHVSADMETCNDLSMHNNDTHLILFRYVFSDNSTVTAAVMWCILYYLCDFLLLSLCVVL